MSRYAVQLTRSAAKDLDHLAPDVRLQVAADLASLAERPLDRPPRVKRLKGVRGSVYRLRSGAFRAVYRIDGTMVTVLRVIDRKDLEAALRRQGL